MIPSVYLVHVASETKEQRCSWGNDPVTSVKQGFWHLVGHQLTFNSGDSSRLVMSQFQQLFDMQPNPATANYDMSVIIPFHAARFAHSVQNNPYFFNAPASGILAASAAHNFVFRFMANHSDQYPDVRISVHPHPIKLPTAVTCI